MKPLQTCASSWPLFKLSVNIDSLGLTLLLHNILVKSLILKVFEWPLVKQMWISHQIRACYQSGMGSPVI